ncbi:MAG: S41 family peptidase [Acidimicrobiia bacterium]|nr:S41 family peptidase [Acidimicrobiia bacterium]MDQ3501327.1 S41 family peptidase [Actinomycetota bacterium]
MLVLVAGCQDPIVAEVDRTNPPSTTIENVTTTEQRTTTASPATIDSQICQDEDDALLCEVYELVVDRYVDPVVASELAAAAAAGVLALDEDTGAVPECVVPSEAFEVVCEAMADEGVSTAIADVAAVQGLISALDPNSVYLSAAALALLEEDQSGSVEGIGAIVNSEDLTADDPATTGCSIVSATCRLVVVSTFADGPARLAGLEVGDVLVAVDGESIVGSTVDEVTAAVRGPAGTRVELRVNRAGETIEVPIVRAALTIPVVETSQVGNVGYLRLNLFTETADRQVHVAIEELLASGAEALVFDLRDNPGGALNATVEIASEFMSDGVVVRTEGPEETLSYPVEDGGLLADGTPVVILVNEGSASASEVLAAALQEQERALVIGTATFGKNTVQQRYPLSDGGALKLTVARWVTEAGSDFGALGVQPDIEADLGPELSIDDLVAEVSRLSGW